jgi:O-antigen ligase
MLLSPEIPLFETAERAVVLRLDDILLVAIFFTWLAKMAVNKELGFVRKTPINLPLGVYTGLYLVITAFAILLRVGQARFNSAFFYILKYIEYFMLFFLAANNLKSIRQSKVFVVFLLIVCFIVCIFGYVQIQQGINRVSAPFEGGKPEPNTLAGYLLVIFGLTAGLFLHSESLPIKILSAAVFIFAIPVFLSTLSRSGYIGLIIIYLTLILFAKRKRFFLTSIFLILIIVMPLILPAKVTTRIRTTFIGKTRYEVLGTRVALDEASAARIETWKYIKEVFIKSPFFGYGSTGINFVDTQYGRIIGEMGLVGLMVFLWLLYSLFKNILKIYRQSNNEHIQSLSIGLLSSLAAFIVISWGTNIFIIVRIMEPFWFITAMVFVLPQLPQIKEGPGEIIGT